MPKEQEDLRVSNDRHESEDCKPIAESKELKRKETNYFAVISCFTIWRIDAKISFSFTGIGRLAAFSARYSFSDHLVSFAKHANIGTLYKGRNKT